MLLKYISILIPNLFRKGKFLHNDGKPIILVI